jgi:hypothetical protein
MNFSCILLSFLLFILIPGGNAMNPEELFLSYEKEVAEFKLELIRKLSGKAAFPEKSRRKRTSNMAMVETVLKDAGKALHVSDIIAAVEERFSILLDRDSLSSAIIKQVRKGIRFERVAPNTFAIRKV